MLFHMVVYQVTVKYTGVYTAMLLPFPCCFIKIFVFC